MMGWEHRMSMLTFDAERLIREAYDLGQKDAQRGEQVGAVGELVEALHEAVGMLEEDWNDQPRLRALLKKYEATK